IPAFGASPIYTVDTNAVQAYKEAQLESGFSRKTINNHLVVLRAVFSLAIAREIIGAAPQIQSFALEAPDLQFLGFDEARALVRAADPDWRLMIILGLRTGLRLGELRALTWDNVDLEHLRLRVQQRSRDRLDENVRSREIPLSEDTAAELRQHPRRGKWVFCTEEGEMLTHGACKWPLYRAARRAGLRQLGWDVLRRTFAAHLTLRGAPLASVQALLGHRSMSTTLRYTQLGGQGTRAAIALLDVKDPGAGPAASGASSREGAGNSERDRARFGWRPLPGWFDPAQLESVLRPEELASGAVLPKPVAANPIVAAGTSTRNRSYPRLRHPALDRPAPCIHC
ncbi:MAG TPA: site-specific integrase, partial [Polyangiaceae bacterium]|nr:site-specific integrase [Polyangiaceae bacterium]